VSLTCLYMAVPKVDSGHYDKLFLFDRKGIPLSADVRNLPRKIDSDEYLMVSCFLPGNDRRCRRRNKIPRTLVLRRLTAPNAGGSL